MQLQTKYHTKNIVSIVVYYVSCLRRYSHELFFQKNRAEILKHFALIVLTKILQLLEWDVLEYLNGIYILLYT